MAKCSEPNCDKPARGRGLCGTHYAYRRRHGTLPALAEPISGCSVEDCDRDHEAHGLCAMHYQRVKKIGSLDQPTATAPDADRFWSKVDRSGGDDSCWLWQAGISTNTGYGNVWWEGKTRSAHRVAYELSVGPIPEGLTLDHVKERGCAHRHCVNPAHLEAVTHRVNMLRSDTPGAIAHRTNKCFRGHKFTPENTYTDKRGIRQCKKCRNAATRRYIDRIRLLKQPE